MRHGAARWIGLGWIVSGASVGFAQLLPPQAAPGQMIVRLTPSGYARAAQVSDILGNRIIGRIPMLGSVLVATDGPQTVARLTRLPEVKSVTPNWLVHSAFTPNDPNLNAQWHLAKINAFSAWDIGRGSANTSIAIVDTGIQYTHPDLSAVYMAGGYDFANGDSDPLDDFGHGTLVAGVASAATNNGIGVAGVAFGSPLIAIKVLDQNGNGTVFNVAQGISYAVTDTDARVINMSLGSTVDDPTLASACQLAYDNGVVLVAAAGNGNTNSPFYPAWYPTSVAVGATDQNDVHWVNSNYGPDWVTVAAPGQDIYSTNLGSGYGSISGTSLAAPVVSGLAALLYNKQGPGRSKIKAAWVRSWICAGAANVSPWTTFGRVDALDSMKFAASVSPLSFSWSPSTTDPTTTVADGTGNIYAAYSQTFPIGGISIVLEKRSSTGSLVWRRTLDGTGHDDQVARITVDTDGSLYVVGTAGTLNATTDTLVARFSSSGTLVWKRVVNGLANSFDAGEALSLSGDKVIAAGYWTMGNPNNREQAVWVLRKSNGSTYTAKTITNIGNSFDQILDSVTRPDGKVYLVASVWVGSDTNGVVYLYDPATNSVSTLGAYNLGPGSTDVFSVVRLAANGDAIVGGTSTLSGDRAVIARVRSAGGFAWLKLTNGTLSDLLVGSGDRVTWCGDLSDGGNWRFVVARNNGTNGAAVWKREIGGLGDLALKYWFGSAKKLVQRGSSIIATGATSGPTIRDCTTLWLNVDSGKLLRVARYDAGGADDAGGSLCYSSVTNNVYVGCLTMQGNGPQFRLLKYAP